MARLHRPDGHAINDPVEVRSVVDRLSVEPFENHLERRAGEDRAPGQHAEEGDAVGRQPALDHPGDARLGIDVDLVDDRPGDVDALGPEERRVQDDLVDRAADAALADDDRRRPEHRRDRGVRKADHRPDAGMAGALDEEHVVGLVGRPGLHHPSAEVLYDLAGDVRLGEAARDVDRAHHVVGLGQAERLVHEDRVLVCRLAVIDHRPLADRLHESGVEPAFEEPVEQTQGSRGLAPVLARGGEVELAHRTGLGRQSRRE